MTPDRIDQYRSLDPEEYPVAMGYRDGKTDAKYSRNTADRRAFNVMSQPINELIICKCEGYDKDDWLHYLMGYMAATFEKEFRAKPMNERQAAAFLKRRIANGGRHHG